MLTPFQKFAGITMLFIAVAITAMWLTGNTPAQQQAANAKEQESSVANTVIVEPTNTPNVARYAPHISYKNGKRFYTVQSGDTLGELAETFGVTVVTIERFNHRTNSLIVIGETVEIPYHD